MDCKEGIQDKQLRHMMTGCGGGRDACDGWHGEVV